MPVDTSTIHPGDLVKGRVTGTVFEVITYTETKVTAKVVKTGPNAGSRDLPVGKRVTNEARNLEFVSCLHDPEPTEQPTNTNTKETSDMDNKHLTNAINNLASEEATNNVRPAYKKLSKLVRKTGIGEGLVLVSGNPTIGTQFYFHWELGKWQYGNGTEVLSDERVIECLVRSHVEEGSTVYRLVEEDVNR